MPVCLLFHAVIIRFDNDSPERGREQIQRVNVQLCNTDLIMIPPKGDENENPQISSSVLFLDLIMIPPKGDENVAGTREASKQ